MHALARILLLALIAAPAAADSWKSTSNSELNFVAKVDGNELPGTFKEFDVELVSNEGDLVSFVVTVNLAAADLGDDDTNSTLFSPAWFGTVEFPQAVFKTSEVVSAAANAKEISGELSLKGAAKAVRFPVTFMIKDNSASLSGSASINRNDFDVGSGEWASSETVDAIVELNFDVQLDRVR